jgi:tetratricopeptide (TPR) repeat protein
MDTPQHASPLPDDLLEPFDGYLALGMFMEANDELERMPNGFKAHPTVLTARLALLMEMERWEAAVILGRSLFKLWPDDTEFCIHTAYCLHELKQTAEAKQTLLDGPDALRDLAVFHYNLACYECQLGNLGEAKRRLATCFKIDRAHRAESLEDPDLEPLWRTLDPG